MSGIYIHIPFCRHKCNYCNFYSLASTRYLDKITNAINAELLQRKDYLGTQQVETIYFGGGTPSMLGISDIESIIKTIYSTFVVATDAEITLEANPDDLSPEKLRELKKSGINRLSIGIQSFREEDLVFLSRTHSAKQVITCVSDAQRVGFNNLSIDLIYGIPTLTNEGWKENLETAFSLEVSHISAYSLTVEEKTPLEEMIRKGKMKPVDEDLSLAHYKTLTSLMHIHGYEQYEVSNFCLPGAYSRHNTAYWQGKHYLGVGPSAHSYNGTSRSWNVANLLKYIESVNLGKVESEHEILNLTTLFNEFIMTSLRTIWGCDLNTVKQKFGSENAENLLLNSLPFIDAKQMSYSNGKLVLTPEGRLFTDGISASLFEEEA